MIAELVNMAFEGYIALIGRKPLSMQHDHAKMIAENDVWVLESASEMVGVLELVHNEIDLYIDTVAVKNTQQSKGLGRQLLAFAETRARELGLNAITLCSNERFGLLGLYARLGYVETHRVDVQGTNAVYFCKMLEKATA